MHTLDILSDVVTQLAPRLDILKATAEGLNILKMDKEVKSVGPAVAPEANPGDGVR